MGDNVHTGVKTTPYVAPPSRDGVVNQTRFWNANTVGNVTPQDPEQRMAASNSQIAAKSNLAQLRQKAIEIESQNQKDLINLQDQKRQDYMDLENQKMDIAEGDVLDQIGKGLVVGI